MAAGKIPTPAPRSRRARAHGERAGTTDFFVGIRDSIKSIADSDQIAIGSVGAAGIFCCRDHPLAQNPHVTGADLRA